MSNLDLRICAGVAAGVLVGTVLPGHAHAQSQAGAVIVYLDPMTTAGVGGTVNLAPQGGDTKLEVTLKGDAPSESKEYRVQVVQGSCSTPGAVVEKFGDVHADGKTTRQEGNLRLSDVRTGKHVIQVAGKGKNNVVACGMIPAQGH